MCEEKKPIPQDFFKYSTEGHLVGFDVIAYSEAMDVWSKNVIEVLRKVADEASRNICYHEETERRGYIWTYCLNCGCKWEDDEGGVPEVKDPEYLTRAWAFLKGAEREET